MSGVSIVVLGLSFQGSRQGPFAVTAGVVLTQPTPSSVPVPSVAKAAPQLSATHPATTPALVTVNGSSVDTQYGPVQVQITLRAGHLVRADAISYPRSGGRDQEINSQAIPALDREAVRAGTSQIDTVSGATFTSDGYRQSLQSALDAAHRAGA